MQRRIWPLIIALAVLGTSYLRAAPLHVPAANFTATTTLAADAWYPVAEVIDGDTIVVKKDGSDVHVRLIGINSPEVQSPYRTQECYGPEASAEAKRILAGSDVRLVTDPSQDLHDKYGRLLAYVYMPANSNPAGVLFNEYMVQGGFAREYTYKKPYEFQKQFKADQAAAKAAHRGLWGACATSS